MGAMETSSVVLSLLWFHNPFLRPYRVLFDHFRCCCRVLFQCSSLPQRAWVTPHRDLDNYSIEQMIEEVTTANTFLKAVDGKTERTYTPPCFDSLAGGEDYLSKVRELFIAVKGAEFEPDFFVIMVPAGATGKELVEYIKTVPTETSLVNIIFHGIGGDHLSVSSDAHMELLKFLSDNDKTYYVDTYINIAKYAKGLNPRGS